MIVLLKTILYIAQGSALWASIVKRDQNKDSSLRNFMFLMILVVITEITANLIRIYTPMKNSFVYNIFIIISFYFYFFWFYEILKKKKIVLIIIGTFTIALFISLFNESFTKTMLSGTLYSGTVAVLILTIMFYVQLMRRNDSFDYMKLQPYWVATGLLIFYLGLLPLQYLLHYSYFDPVIYQFAIMILNIILYGCIAKAILCPIKK